MKDVGAAKLRLADFERLAACSAGGGTAVGALIAHQDGPSLCDQVPTQTFRHGHKMASA